MYKMIVTGFDGVLVDDDLAISLSTMLEIDRIRRKKMLFTIATSRCLGDILYYNRDFSFLDYVIASDGAIVYDVNKEKVIFKKAVSVSCIRKIYNTFTSHDIYACRKDRKFKLLGLDDITDVYKLEIVCSSRDDSLEVIDKLKSLNLKINYFEQYINDTYYVDIVSLDIDKFVGVEKICDKKKISTEEVVSFGKHYNDINLVKNTGLGVSMDNAIKEVKKVSKKSTLDNLNKGVEVFIKNNF